MVYHVGGAKIVVEDTIRTFENLILEVSGIWTWTFSYDFKLLKCNCPSPNLFTKIMLDDIYKNELCKSGPGAQPLILSNNMNLMYSAVFGPEAIMFIGPIYTTEMTDRDFKMMLKPYNLSIFNTEALLNNLRLVPLLASYILFEKTMIMHRLITGERTDISSFRYFMAEKRKSSSDEFTEVYHSSLSVENQLMDNVRNGNLDFSKALSLAALKSYGIKVKSGIPIVQARYSVVAFITLCSRAAIEGGLPSNTAYTLADQYTTELNTCNTINEVMALSHRMYEDYIVRVHRSKLDSGLTRGVRVAAEYIDMNPDKDLSLDLIAQKAGYAPYYLSKIFNKEIGTSINAYIRKARIKKAAELLKTTDMTIQDIGESLYFSSRSHFSSTFTKEMGIGPAAYRNEVQDL